MSTPPIGLLKTTNNLLRYMSFKAFKKLSPHIKSRARTFTTLARRGT